MARRVVVLRPEPGNARTCAALAERGLTPEPLPLFTVRACPWTAPEPMAFDALLLTSANAARHGGAALAAVAGLPVVAVGAATAAAARQAGLTVAITGGGDAAQAVAQAGRFPRLLHLAGRDRIALPGVTAVTVYASEAVAIDSAAAAARAAGQVVLLHSARAATRFAALMAGGSRASTRLVAISDPVAAAAGTGWHDVAIAAHASDPAMIDGASRVAIDP